MKRILFALCSLLLLFMSGFNDVQAKSKEEWQDSGEIVWNVPSERKLIAITFDDGPHPLYTPLIMDVLQKHQAKATFFVIGKHAERYPELLQRGVEEGHEIGNHTYEHVGMQGISDDLFLQQLEKTEQAIIAATGIRPVFFRSVGGYYDDRLIKLAADEGYRTIIWSWHQDSRDWKRPGVANIINNVAPGSHPGDIVLFHDAGGNRSETVKALDKILDQLEKEGFEFVTVSELLLHSGYEGIPSELIGL
ncbi:polysaccharide deacetylase family protein [Geomicrobium sp. JCM 19038]|uniref:polysaccharide deacetylase family protein n=1 Tax=Geomicrobium sp. JCM 19038 TaxID=1460635 RepID=UPI00045F43C1|nr:polysaccharide deacetylase family protein [Geomicrobium sp. JCM 19038]GAK09767.1 peptidoglycan N-acetylglucosamine deacetylase [Geomicrobium sp. JCM 19038]